MVMSMQEYMHREIGNPYIVDTYNFDIVESALLTRGWYKECCMLVVVDHMPWATLRVLLGSTVTVLKSCMVMYI